MAAVEMNKNIISLKVNDMIKLLVPLYLNGINNKTISQIPTLMLWGAPGVGKSQSFKEIARQIEKLTGKKVNTTDVRLLLFNPVDLRGIPVADETRTFAKWLKPQIFNMDPSDDVVNFLILDEISAAPVSVQAAAYQLTLDRMVGEHKLPDNCIVIAAGNRVTDKSVAYKMPKALGNRMTHLEIICDVEDWKQWAIPNGISQEIIAYITYRDLPALFDFDPNNDFNAYPTPRSWEMVDKYIKMYNGDLQTALPLIAGSIGLGAAQEFLQYTKVFTNLPDIGKILNGDYLITNAKGDIVVEDGAMPTEPDVLYALSAAIVAKMPKATKEQVSNVLNYLNSMSAEYATITVKDMLKFDQVKKIVLSVNEWIKWSEKFKEYIL